MFARRLNILRRCLISAPRLIFRNLLNRVWKRATIAIALVTIFLFVIGVMINDYQNKMSVYNDKLESKVETPKDRKTSISLDLQVLADRFEHAKDTSQSTNISLPIITDALDSIEVTIDLARDAFIQDNLNLAEKYVDDASNNISELLPKIDASYIQYTISVVSYHNLLSGSASENLKAITKDGSPLSLITFTADGAITKNENEKVLAGVNISPEGVSFNNVTNLIMYYDPSDIPDGWLEDDIILMHSSFTENDIETLSGNVDTSIHSITAPINDLGTFWVLAIKPSSPPSFPIVYIIISFAIFAPLIYITFTYKENSRQGKTS